MVIHLEYWRKSGTDLKRFFSILILVLINQYLPAQIQHVRSFIELEQELNRVSVRYFLDSLPEQVSFKIILFGEVRIDNLTASVNQREVAHKLIVTDWPLIEGKVLNSEVNGSATLEFNYDVSGADRDIGITPVVIPDLASPSNNPEAFSAQVNFSSDKGLTPLFPAVPWEMLESSASFTMQVIPSVIKMQRYDRGYLGTMNSWVDGLVLVLLTGLFYLGWLRLKSQES